jgi:hypothetical protein
MKIHYLSEPPKGEIAAYAAANLRVLRMLSESEEFTTTTAEVIPSERNPQTGWIEWLIVIRNALGEHRITIGMIQRERGADFEFHS